MREQIRLRSMIVKKEKVIEHVQPNPALQGRRSKRPAADFADSPSPGEVMSMQDDNLCNPGMQKSREECPKGIYEDI